MKHSVHQHWDPLKVCLVGRSYPPEFYSRVKNPKVRSVMERIAVETEEDYQKLITLLEKFNVKVLRTDISDDVNDYINCNDQGIVDAPPPMCPRDFTLMVGDTFFMPGKAYGENFSVSEVCSAVLHHCLEQSDANARNFAKTIEDQINPNNNTSPTVALMKLRSRLKKDNHWEIVKTIIDIDPIREMIIQSQTQTIGSNVKFPNNKKFYALDTAKQWLEDNNVPVKYDQYLGGATTFRVGKDLIFGNVNMIDATLRESYKKKWQKLFPDYRIHTKDVGSHVDGTMHPVKPGLIVALSGVDFSKSFPDWEVVRVDEREGWKDLRGFMSMKRKVKGKWWVPGEEDNQDLIDFVENWLYDWVTYVEETVFDINMFVIDQKNVVVNGYNKTVFDAFERHGITPHPLPLRHRYFWDGGLHCITSDISREGEQVDYFPERNV